MRRIDTFYNERSDTLVIDIDGTLTTLSRADAWRLLDLIEAEMFGQSLVEDHKGD
jgi:hypothetical protein